MSKELKKQWSDLDINMVKILTQPIIPPALHGVSPRSIMGEAKWKKLKTEYRDKADHHCMICKRYVEHKPGDYLELHEIYEYDFKNLIQEIVGFVSICRQCHLYIHQGYLRIQVRLGKISEDTAIKIITRGDNILSEFGLEKIGYPSEEVFHSLDWKLEYQGNFYKQE